MTCVYRLCCSLVFFILFFAFLGGCTFAPSRENIVPVKPPEPIAFSVDVSDPGFVNPYYIKGYTKFDFVISNLTKPVISSEVLLDGVNVSAGPVNGNIVSYTLTSYVSGTHTIVVRIRIATETGSLADIEGQEYYTIEKKLTIIIDPTPPIMPNPPTISYENGFPTLRWKAPSQKNFYYAIKRIYKPSFIPDTLIYDTSQDNFIDRGYVGGSVTYKILAKGYGFGQIELGSVDFNQNPIVFNLSYNDEKQVQLSWNQSLINTDNSTLTVYSNIKTEIPLTSSGKLTIDTLVLGESQSYQIEIVRNKYPYQLYSLTKDINQPSTLKDFNSFVMLPHHNKLLIVSSKAIYRYNLSDLTLEDSLEYQDAGVSDFSSIIVNERESRAIIVGGATQLVGFDPLSLGDLITYPISQAIQGISGTNEISNITLGSLSNDNLLTMSVGKSTGVWGLVFEINTNNIPWASDTFLATETLRPPVVSVDGNYLVFDLPTDKIGEVYYRTSGSYTKIGTVAEGLKFFRNRTNELFSTTYIAPVTYGVSPQIKVYDLQERPSTPNSSFTITRTRSITKPLLSNTYYTDVKYDDATQVFYTREMRYIYSTIRLLDINDFHETANMQARNPFTGFHTYANGYSLLSTGYLEKIK